MTGGGLGARYVPVLRRHALHAGTNAHLDHARADLVRHVDAGLQARRALPVEGAHGHGLGEAGDQAGGAHLGGAATGGEDGADGDVFDEGRVDLGAVENPPQRAGYKVGGHGVFEAALAALGKGGAEAGCYDDLRWVWGVSMSFLLLGYMLAGRCAHIIGVLLEELGLALLRAHELAADGGESVEGCGGSCQSGA